MYKKTYKNNNNKSFHLLINVQMFRFSKVQKMKSRKHFSLKDIRYCFLLSNLLWSKYIFPNFVHNARKNINGEERRRRYILNYNEWLLSCTFAYFIMTILRYLLSLCIGVRFSTLWHSHYHRKRPIWWKSRIIDLYSCVGLYSLTKKYTSWVVQDGCCSFVVCRYIVSHISVSLMSNHTPISFM
jgi:hypothetical protein